LKIVILGGGTAGWLAALMISKIQPQHSVTVVESSEIGIVGAGEGSTGVLLDIIRGTYWDLGCDEAEFFRETKATPKLGIHHINWKTLGHSYLAPLDGYQKGVFGTYPGLMHSLANGHPFHTSTRGGYLLDKSLSPFYMDENGEIKSEGSYAAHFDAHLVGKYFKKKCTSVSTIDAKIVDATVDETGFVKSVKLDSGQVVEADFFIDATGFNRVLHKKLGVSWTSYSEYLPVNTAMPFLLPYEENHVIHPVTTAFAQKNGWVWMIPTQDRMGCGYVFDSRYTSNEDAQKEIEEVFGREIEPIRFLNFDTGRSAELWKNNCLFIGLSAAFAEPLEATSIHSTIMQLHYFIFNNLKNDVSSTCNQGSIKAYNDLLGKLYDGFRDFLSAHYSGQRTDTEFWRDITRSEKRTERALRIIESARDRSIIDNDVDIIFGYAGSGIWNWVLAGLGHITKDTADKELRQYGQADQGSEEYHQHINRMSYATKDYIDNTAFVSLLQNKEI
jgi:tryptophan halogenase